MTDSTEPLEGVRLLGSEMFTWSDLEGDIGPVGGPLLPVLLERALRGRSGRALVVGPHDPGLIATVARTFATTDVLVRSHPDALSLRATLHDEGVQVMCGAFAALPQADGYDVVIALDGLGRLLSSDEPRLPWSSLVERLLALLAADGEILLGIGNTAGVDHLLALDPDSRDIDAHWPLGQRIVDEVPLGLAELTERLGTLMPGRELGTWAAYGPRLSPTLVAPSDAVRQLRKDGVFGALMERATRQSVAGHQPLREPGLVTRTLLQHGLGLDTAPLWIFHGRRPASAADDDAILCRDATTGEPGVVVALTSGGTGWTRELVAEPPAVREQVAPGVVRDVALLTGPVPTGTFVSDDLAECCVVQDMSAAGAIVRRYRDWLADGAGSAADGDPAPPVSSARAALTLDLVVDTGQGLAAFDPSLRAEAAASVDEVLTRALVVFADDLLASGRRHAWPLSYGADQIARTLVAAAGLEVEKEALVRARELDAQLRLDRADGGTPTLSYAEAVELVERYRAHAADAEEQVEWLLVNIHRRQRWLWQSQRRNREVTRSAEYRIGKQVLWARDQGRRLRNQVRQWRNGPAPAAGEWREATAAEREPIPVDPELLPPGYKAKGPML